MDPDYRESSDDDDEDQIPKKLSVIRARWIEENVDELQELMRAFCDAGTKHRCTLMQREGPFLLHEALSRAGCAKGPAARRNPHRA